MVRRVRSLMAGGLAHHDKLPAFAYFKTQARAPALHNRGKSESIHHRNLLIFFQR
jgi:hypothetical protein